MFNKMPFLTLKNSSKNQFILLNNSHFVMNVGVGGGDETNTNTNKISNQNYTNVTIWREELNAKNNVQQQIKKQVNEKK